jgi:hypothetical protein
MSTLEARLSYFRFTPNSRPYVKLIDWPKGAKSRPEQVQQRAWAKLRLLHHLVR